MKRQTLIALGVALVLGLVAVYIANGFLLRNAEEARQNDMAKVAVAAVPLEYGAELTPDKVKFVDFPVSSIPAGTFASWEQLTPEGKQRVVLRSIMLNEPILAAKLAGEGQNPSIAYLLPDGMRAAAVRVNDVSGVAGFIQPSDSVDVLITRQVQGGSGQQITDVLLQNVRVIAMDQNAKDANGQPILAKTATLEVTPTAAQKLALAQQIGSLSLVLRKPGQEQDIAGVQTVSMNDLRYNLYSSRPPVQTAAAPRSAAVRATPRRAVRQAAPAPAAPAKPVTNNVEVVRGTEGSNYEVGGYGS